VGAKRFTELQAWQLARQLKVEVGEAILAKPEAQADQLSDAVRSAPRNLAEGFGRYHHREFAHFTRIARSSLKETQNHILDAHDRRLIDQLVLERLLKYLTGRKDR
jgi:four helix bundle protein